MEALKKSRSAYSGTVTRIWNRYARLLEEDPSSFYHRQLEHKLESIRNTDLSYHKIHEEISLAGEGTLSPEEEQETLETFEDSVERTRSLLTRLIAIQTLSNLSSEIQFDLEELDSKMQAHPDRDYSATLSTITTTLKELKLALGKSTINHDHQLRRVAKYLSSQLIDLSSEERKLPSSTTTTTICEVATPRPVQLPKIALPTFEGDVMKWATFWKQFQAAVDRYSQLTNANKLAYLRDAIRDPPTRSLLFSGTEDSGYYSEIVDLLKQRFDKRRIIHATYCRTLADVGPVKATCSDLNAFADKLSQAVSGLVHTGQFDGPSIITSLCVSSLNRTLQVEWELHTKEHKDVPSIQELITFVSQRADALAGQLVQTTSTITKPELKPDPPRRTRAAVHTTQPTAGFKYDCLICPGEKHPLYLCSKFNSMSLDQRAAHTRTNNVFRSACSPHPDQQSVLQLSGLWTPYQRV